MSEAVQQTGSWTEADYAEAKREAIAKTVAFLQVGEALGKEPQWMAAEFLATFQMVAEDVFGK